MLVGTTSIENSELISGMLQQQGLPHQVLNAKQHAREAEIVAQAGRPKMLTIATNMAGRGTDIVLGGNVEKQVDMIRATADLEDAERERRIRDMREGWQALHDEVVRAGGLHIIGTERHESRRIDNQLRGRSGRQGDPGSSRFYLSLEDPLLRIFAGDRVKAIMERLKMPEGEAIEHPLVTRSIESAQRKVEAHNFDIRKQLLEYDDVANDQRRHIYELRNAILDSSDVSDRVQALREGVVTDLFRAHIPEESVEEQWDVAGLEKALAAELQVDVPLSKWLEEEPEADDKTLLAGAVAAANEAYAKKMETAPAEALHQYERFVLLSTLDTNWREHLGCAGSPAPGYTPARLRPEEPEAGIQARGLRTVRRHAGDRQARGHPQPDDGADSHPGRGGAGRARTGAGRGERPVPASVVPGGAATGTDDAAPAPEVKAQPFVRHMGKIGRNDPCPCGSGKKYKHCHGRLT